MVTNPSVLILDEPTSGLDAFTAYKVMSVLKNPIATSGRTVIATIHQPASQIFDTFDTLLLMHKGQVAYFGPAHAAVKHFAAVGVTCPPHFNPADFLIQTLMEEAEHGGEIDFVQKWSEVRSKDFSRQEIYRSQDWASAVPHKRVGVLSELACISKRNLTNYKRDKLGLRTRVGQTLFFSIFTGLLFWDLTLDFKGIQDRQGLLFFSCVNMLLQGALQVVLMFPIERKIFEREFSSGYYRVSSYFLGKTTSELPFNIIPPIVFALILYNMAGLQSSPDKMFIFVGVITLLLQCAVSLGYFIGCAVPTPEMAVALVPVFLVPFLLTGGLLINKDRLDPYFIWLEKISFISYAYEALIINEFSGLTFTYEETIFLQPGTSLSGQTTLTQDVTLQGETVIARLGMADGEIWWNCIALIIWSVVARMIAYFLLLLRAYGWRRLFGCVATKPQHDSLNKPDASRKSSEKASPQRKKTEASAV